MDRTPRAMRWLIGFEGQDADPTARYSAIAACWLLAGGQAGYAAVDLGLFGLVPIVWARWAHTAVCLGTLAFLWSRPALGWRTSTGLLYLLILPLFPLFWGAEAMMVTLGDAVWVPFSGHKLVIVGMALLLPGSPLIAMGFIAAFVLLALIQHQTSGMASALGLVATGEPWFTLIYGILGCMMVGSRARARAMADRLARSRAQAERMEEVARFLLVVRDMANTPLQRLEIDLKLLQWNHPDLAPSIERMRRATAELRELRTVFSHYDHLIPVELAEASPDPEEVKRWLSRLGREGPSATEEAPR